MLLKSLDVLNAQGSRFHLALDDNTTGFSIKNIDGLDPVDATISSGVFAQLDGEQYYTARRQKRNIKISLGLNPNFAFADVKTLRDQLYSYFMPKSQIQMTFNMFDRFAQTVAGQNLSLTISGRIETFATALFTQDPQVDISIICFNPDFEDPRVIEIDGVATSSDWSTAPLAVQYDGTVDTGVLFNLYPTDTTTSFLISHITPDGVYHNVYFTYPLLYTNNDIATISSIPGSKFVSLRQYGSGLDEAGNETGVVKSILYALSAQSAWIALQPGLNHFSFSHGGSDTTWKMKYTNKYGGL